MWMQCNAKWNVSIAHTHLMGCDIAYRRMRYDANSRSIPKPIFFAKRHKEHNAMSIEHWIRTDPNRCNGIMAFCNLKCACATQIAAPQKFSIIFHYYHYDSCLNISVWILLEIKRENISHHKSRLVCLNCWLLWNGLKELIFCSRGFTQPTYTT